jgi:hypothetical protein
LAHLFYFARPLFEPFVAHCVRHPLSSKKITPQTSACGGSSPYEVPRARSRSTEERASTNPIYHYFLGENPAKINRGAAG